ncbi:MAG: DUF2240 family protein [Candidatus Thermoplasmatota archaeon]|nr:DUF2240 family protein [Candidatus Thermoplasmatota archaeon]MBS3790255.1 DUF2240 family protein [Candidatus Thermoplasmatota archaeon]
MKKALAFLFQKEGKEITKEDFIYAQSVDMEWFSSDRARKLMDKAVDLDLIKIREDKILANFDYENVDVPMGFKPSKEIFEEEKKDIFPALLAEIAKKSDLSKQEIMSKVNEKQDRLNIEITTATLLVAHEYNIPLEDRYQRIEEISRKIRGKK